ncbi:hypothetical protein PPTG_16405 [Phytophthora nicotianae INRA-310]|uniref:Uncharacterized protein n=1 Tax=Phytophthora nicotianae (strain INRA-310) TaxID=761204 RepID=W2PNK1_PHYN3|nr:hypothetical protein PPTG_16405 [Phytophthora nicotianae INRA-310]ETN02447.1 hypothetical protein PPTG_16405 [Phytophthora nicotianae INRA-310]
MEWDVVDVPRAEPANQAEAGDAAGDPKGGGDGGGDSEADCVAACGCFAAVSDVDMAKDTRPSRDLLRPGGTMDLLSSSHRAAARRSRRVSASGLPRGMTDYPASVELGMGRATRPTIRSAYGSSNAVA